MKQKLVELFKSSAGNAEYFLRKFRYPKDELIVLCMHSTPQVRMPRFGEIIDSLTKHFKILDPKDSEKYFAGELTDGPYLLFTFDDGLKNNLHAAKVLENKGIHAMFFIVPDFVEAGDSRDYYRRHIRPVIDPDFDRENEDLTAMSYNDLKALIDAGHWIGAHSTSHKMTAAMSENELDYEIKSCIERIHSKLGIIPSSFCSINNTTASVNSAGKRKIAEAYNYHFTTFPGLNGVQKHRQLIFRRNIEVNWSDGKIRYSLGRFDLGRWYGAIQQFQAL